MEQFSLIITGFSTNSTLESPKSEIFLHFQVVNVLNFILNRIFHQSIIVYNCYKRIYAKKTFSQLNCSTERVKVNITKRYKLIISYVSKVKWPLLGQCKKCALYRDSNKYYFEILQSIL